jgi:hypothetical protein
MSELRYTLLSEGSSDRSLLPILNWLLQQHFESFAIQPQWADLRQLRKPPQYLADRIVLSLSLYPCDLLFIHRDADNRDPETRYDEIREALQEVTDKGDQVPTWICVVPVRAQEAWLLFDETALRHAAGNPNGTQPLDLPDLSTIERIEDPKSLLYELLRKASELQGRRLRKFRANVNAYRVAELIEDFSPLRHLSAFNRLEREIMALQIR